MGLDRMTQWLVSHHLIAILPAHLFATDESLVLQVLNDSLHRPFRDADTGGNLPEDELWIGVQHGQHMGVVGQEGPSMGGLGIRSSGGAARSAGRAFAFRPACFSFFVLLMLSALTRELSGPGASHFILLGHPLNVWAVIPA